MQNMFESMRAGIKKADERERKLERPIEKVSRLIWPWQESKLLLFVSLMAVLDFISTFSALKFYGKYGVFESGWIAKWALSIGGFPELFLVDAIAIGVLIIIAIGIRAFYNRLGFPGFARSAFVFIFVPYSIIIIPVIINNILHAFR
jgi:hypothetical protein